MRRLKLLLTSFAFVFAIGAPALLTTGVSAVEFECNNDLAVSKQVKVPGGSFVDAASAANAPSAHVGDTVEWQIGVSNNPGQGCEGTPELPGTIVLHDTLPASVTFVSGLTGAGSYDSSTNDWSFTSSEFSSTTTIYLDITTTANQVGSFENVATLSQLVGCPDQEEKCAPSTADYEDDISTNNSANAWVNIQTPPQVLGESTTSDPQVLGLTDTGTSTVVQSIIAGLFIVSALAVISWGAIFKKRSHYKA